VSPLIKRGRPPRQPGTMSLFNFPVYLFDAGFFIAFNDVAVVGVY
jgi:hypothetical protein